HRRHVHLHFEESCDGRSATVVSVHQTLGVYSVQRPVFVERRHGMNDGVAASNRNDGESGVLMTIESNVQAPSISLHEKNRPSAPDNLDDHILWEARVFGQFGNLP